MCVKNEKVNVCGEVLFFVCVCVSCGRLILWASAYFLESSRVGEGETIVVHWTC